MLFMHSSDGVVLSVSDASDEPLHSQLTRQIRAKILRGTLTDRQSLPSIRALARAQRVSVITVQRAYDDLERDASRPPARSTPPPSSSPRSPGAPPETLAAFGLTNDLGGIRCLLRIGCSYATGRRWSG